MTPTSVIPAKPPRHRKRRAVIAAEPPPPTPVLPVLVAASFDAGELVLTLRFDVAVDASALDPAQLVVRDGPTSAVYAGAGAASVISPVQVAVPMVSVGSLEASGTLLEASDSTGIIAAGPGGEEWAGAVDVSLPLAPPPVPAVVVATWADGGSQFVLTFDQPIELLGPPDDDAITGAGNAAYAASLDSPEALRLTISTGVGPGSVWAINHQPDWIATPIASPQGGTFE